MSYATGRIKAALSHAAIANYDDYPGFVIMSDCHRGNGSFADNFMTNRPIYTAALKYYAKKGFAYVELGDGEELWENRHFEDIRRTHSEVYSIFAEFARQNRLFMIYGNHDKVLRHSGKAPSLIIKGGPKDLFLIHGNQGDLLNDSLWKIARWLVRYLWKPLELRGFRNPTSPARNIKKLRKTEARFIRFSCDNDCILISGHTHRPGIFDDRSCGKYFNSGSCVHPNAITALEIEGGIATLVKWSVCAGDDLSLFICREPLATSKL